MRLLRTAIAIGCLTIIPGCAITDQNNTDLTEREVRTPLPTFAEPPKVEHYAGLDYIMDDREVKNYFEALTNYNNYVESYLTFVATQYNYPHERHPDCKRLLKFNKIDLPALPILRGASTEAIPEILLGHIRQLRSLIRKYNEEIDLHNRQVDRYCH